MLWDWTMLAAHAAMLFALAALSRQSPDRLQRCVIGGLIVAGLVLLAVDIASVCGAVSEAWSRLAHMAYGIEHAAVLLYVFRIFVSDQERRCLPTSSRPSRR